MRDAGDLRKGRKKNRQSERVHRHESYTYRFLTSEFLSASTCYLSKC